MKQGWCSIAFFTGAPSRTCAGFDGMPATLDLALRPNPETHISEIGTASQTFSELNDRRLTVRSVPQRGTNVQKHTPGYLNFQ
jgi:hypothetical protein